MNMNTISISKKDMDELVRIHQKLTVDFPQGKASKTEVLTSIKASGTKMIPKGALKALKQVQIVSVSDEAVWDYDQKKFCIRRWCRFRIERIRKGQDRSKVGKASDDHECQS